METLLALTFSGTALALLLLLLRYLILRKMPSTVYYYAWLLVLLRFLLPLPGLVPFASGTTPASVPVAIYESEPTGGDPGTQISIPGVTDQEEVQNLSAGTETEPFSSEREEPVSTAAPSVRMNWRSPALWLSVWAVGAATCFGITVFSYLRFTRRLRRSLQEPESQVRAFYDALPGRKPVLYSSRALKTPLMCGVIHPCIILPARQVDEELLANILRHELTHYRRRDPLYKWIAVAVCSLHWFNPVAWLVRREINRACELSCDERLLRSMSRAEKQSYGNTLLNMAASSSLPAGVVATTFSTEKKNLKERLEQIMNYKKSGARVLAAVLALVLLTGCATVVGLQPENAEADDADSAVIVDDAVHVSNVDDFLSAIAPNTTIILEAGNYDLSAASSYAGDSGSHLYTWSNVFTDGKEASAELLIQGVDGLTILGAGMDQTTIAAVPRYANVIRFLNCRELRISDLTAGHTTEPGFCSGGVLKFESCSDVSVDSCGLYGCGTVGVDATDTNGLSVIGCRIYECSYNAVSARQCRSVLVEDCEVHHHGTREGQGSSLALFTAVYSDGVVIHGNRVHDNASQFLLQLNYTKNAAFLSNDVRDNRFDSGVFQFEQYGATVDGCAFENNNTRNWVQSSGVYANDVSGKLLDAGDFEAMTLREIDPDIAVTPAPVAKAEEVAPGGEIAVTTVDEFLQAIGPDRSIVLEGSSFDLSTASNYGSVGGEFYYWKQSYDGPELVIQNVGGLSIRAESGDPEATTLAAVPRYANVLNFLNCNDLVLTGFTAGHTKELGACSGGVLNFQNCSNVRLDNMRLYGCGVLGIQAAYCKSMDVLRTEIYECSQGAAQFFQCDGLNFDGCDIHDVPSPAFRFTRCADKTWNHEAISGFDSEYDVDVNGSLVEYKFGEGEIEMEYSGALGEYVQVTPPTPQV